MSYEKLSYQDLRFLKFSLWFLEINLSVLDCLLQYCRRHLSSEIWRRASFFFLKKRYLAFSLSILGINLFPIEVKKVQTAIVWHVTLKEFDPQCDKIWTWRLIWVYPASQHYENTSIQIYWKFTTKRKKWKFSDKILWYFSYICSKHRLWVLVRTASARRF